MVLGLIGSEKALVYLKQALADGLMLSQGVLNANLTWRTYLSGC